jgi:hypothetical protein
MGSKRLGQLRYFWKMGRYSQGIWRMMQAMAVA